MAVQLHQGASGSAANTKAATATSASSATTAAPATTSTATIRAEAKDKNQNRVLEAPGFSCLCGADTSKTYMTIRLTRTAITAKIAEVRIQSDLTELRHSYTATIASIVDISPVMAITGAEPGKALPVR